ncbi:Nup120 protein [Candida orthopsilosis Co 90-125]|uniref:Nup120 protein n=1 Tax=Candida orthopsilosis (strain 90-125) TaxID=1136231 RepID=H8X7S3_CANO9|nr:Nup120 protein [Candida orthopsilosis Co 90-125]CCG23859.1 Nup120 protein [Candida orthopsilosis Co 90-125]
MNVSYSLSNVVGYSNHLPTLDVSLPLKYPETSTLRDNPNDQFHLKLAATGQLLKFHSTSLIPLVSCSILNDLTTIVLTPIERKVNSLGLKFQNIRIHLPHKISSTSCFDIYHDSENIYINIIDSNYLLISLKLPTETFVSSKTLSLFDFEEWGHISVPYSFEMRSNPYLVKSIDELNVLVSLKDGGLLHFQKQHALSAVEIYTFSEPISFLGGLFGGKKRDIELGGVSSNSIVDLINSDDYLITLTTSRQLKLWSLAKHQYVSSTSLNDRSDEDIWLTTVPSKYLQIFDVDGEAYITLFNPTTGGSKKSRFTFQTWQFKEQSLIKVSKFEFQPELPNFLLSSSDIFYHESTFQNTIWFIQDFATEYADGNLFNHVLWKSNTSSILVTYTINFDNGAITSIKSSSPPLHNEEEEISVHFDSEYYCREIFDSGRFDDLIVSTSLSILRQHYKSQHEDFDGDLRTSAKKLVEFNSTTESSKHVWFKLYSLCEEFRKDSHEALALISFDKHLIAVHANGYGLFRPSHYFESLISKNLQSPEGKLTQLFNRFRTTLSAKAYHRLSESIISRQSQFDATTVDVFFQTHLSEKLPQQEIQTTMSELEDIPNVLQIIQSLVTDADYQLIEIVDQVGELGEFFKLSTYVTFKNIMHQHSILLIDLLILLLVCEVNEEILSLLNQAMRELQQYHFSKIIFETCFVSAANKSSLESHGLGNVDYSLFWSAIVNKDSTLKQLVDNLRINDAYDYFHNDVLTKKGFILNSVVELINHQQGPYLKKFFLDKLDQNDVDELFLIGIIHLMNNDANSFHDAFSQFDKFENLDVAKLKSLKQDENLRHFLSCFYTLPTQGEYYHGLSELIISQVKVRKTTGVTRRQMMEVALKFDKLAIESTKDEPSKAESLYLSVFDLALSISDYDSVGLALQNLTSTTQVKTLLTRFIEKLISESKIELIFPPNESKVYRSHFKLIDSILLKLAQSTPLLSSLKMYQILSSWRLFGCCTTRSQLGDQRGSCEALYQFIQRYKNEITTIDKASKFQVLQMYLLILNNLKSFDDVDDQWFFNSASDAESSSSSSIITANRIQIEYLEWMKNLETDLSTLE